MKNANSEKKSCGCNGNAGRHLFMGIVLFAIGAAFSNGYSSSDVLMIVGALFILKGIFSALTKNKCC